MPSRQTLRCLVACMLVVACMGFWAPCALASGSPTSPRVYLVLATGLRWRDVSPQTTPALWALASQGGVGNLVAVSRTRELHEPPSPLEGALDLSAGDWATPDYTALAGYDATESVDGSDASSVYARVSDGSMGDHRIAYLGFAQVARSSRSNADAATVGALGQAIHDAGGVTVAIGNSDSGPDGSDGLNALRPAAAAAADRAGLVDFGDVSGDLLTPSAQAPYGVRTNLGALARALSASEASASAHGGPALIAIDPGDAYRAARYARRVSGAARDRTYVAAVGETDAVVALAEQHARPGDVIVVATQAPADELPDVQGFSPLIVRGAGLAGYLTSPSTHRQGVVTDPDVSAFVLAALGVPRPLEFVGTPLASRPARTGLAQRIRALAQRDETAVAIISAGRRFAELLIGWVVLVMAATAALLAWGRRLAEHRRAALSVAVRTGALVALAVPPACWAMFLARRDVGSSRDMWLLLLAAALLLAAIAALVWRFAGERAGLIVLPTATVALLGADQLLGAPLSFTNLLGYSPLQAARFYGIGNEAAAVVVGCTLVATALALDSRPVARWADPLRRWGILALGAVVVVICAAPTLGANVGVAIWGTVAFLALWLRANGRRVTWRLVLVAVLAVALLLGGLLALDLLGGGQRTHLARMFTTTLHGGSSELATLVSRKAATNVRQLTKSRWPLMLLALAALLGLAQWLPGRPLARVLAENPALASALIAGAVGGAFALVTEDTGILVPTFLLLPLGLVVAWLLAEYAGRADAPSS